MYAYACLYQSDTDRVMEVDPEEITLTFVCMRYPRKLLGHLKKGRELQDLMERYERHRHSKWYQAAMDLIVRANWDRMKEEKVSLICETARRFAPDYDVDEIYAALAERGRRGTGEKQVNEPSGCVSGK